MIYVLPFCVVAMDDFQNLPFSSEYIMKNGFCCKPNTILHESLIYCVMFIRHRAIKILTIICVRLDQSTLLQSNIPTWIIINNNAKHQQLTEMIKSDDDSQQMHQCEIETRQSASINASISNVGKIFIKMAMRVHYC